MSKLAATLFALALAGCTVAVTPAPIPTGSPKPGASGTPAPAASLTPAPASSATPSAPASAFPLDDLSGPWTFGSSAEPTISTVTVSCIGYAATTLDLQQTGNTVTGTVTACMGACRLTERLTGTRSQFHLDLTGTASSGSATDGNVTYSLDLSPQTGHLSGTRNGQPYWAVRAVPPAGKENCPR
jgi:hypothetical protein